MRFALRTLSCACLSLAAWLGALPDAAAQQPLRIGGSFSNTGTDAQLGQTVHRGHQRCVKHANERGGVLGGLPQFYEQLGRTAEFVYGPTQWEPELVTLRAGGLVPIARQFPGAREFVESYRKEFPGADLSYQTAQGYGACQILLEGIRRAGSLDGDKVRDAILQMDLRTVFGAFKVDTDGIQVAHKMLMLQWQDGKKVIVWPEELAPGPPRFPTPPWSQR